MSVSGRLEDSAITCGLHFIWVFEIQNYLQILMYFGEPTLAVKNLSFI